MERKSIGLMSVSYTHLDVYKRQEQRWETLPEGLSSNNSIKHLQNGIQIIEEYRDKFQIPPPVRNHLSVCPVSYTHLHRLFVVVTAPCTRAECGQAKQPEA